MKRQIGVSIFLAILLLILVWLYIKINNETKPKENAVLTEDDVFEDDASIINKEDSSYQFYVDVEYEKLVVYTCKDDEIYMETSIDKSSLPPELQKRLQERIYFHTEKELYDFLESYSS